MPSQRVGPPFAETRRRTRCAISCARRSPTSPIPTRCRLRSSPSGKSTSLPPISRACAQQN